MVSEKWCVSWPNCIQMAHQRGLSDHVPVVLDVDNANWGPCPLRMLKCQAEYHGYAEFVHGKLNSFFFFGWMGWFYYEKQVEND